MTAEQANLAVDLVLKLAILLITVGGAWLGRRVAESQRARQLLAQHQTLDLVALRAVLAAEQVLGGASGHAKLVAAVGIGTSDLSRQGIDITAATRDSLTTAIEAQVMGALKLAHSALAGAVATPAADAPAIPAVAEQDEVATSATPGASRFVEGPADVVRTAPDPVVATVGVKHMSGHPGEGGA